MSMIESPALLCCALDPHNSYSGQPMQTNKYAEEQNEQTLIDAVTLNCDVTNNFANRLNTLDLFEGELSQADERLEPAITALHPPPTPHDFKPGPVPMWRSLHPISPFSLPGSHSISSGALPSFSPYPVPTIVAGEKTLLINEPLLYSQSLVPTSRYQQSPSLPISPASFTPAKVKPENYSASSYPFSTSTSNHTMTLQCLPPDIATSLHQHDSSASHLHDDPKAVTRGGDNSSMSNVLNEALNMCSMKDFSLAEHLEFQFPTTVDESAQVLHKTTPDISLPLLDLDENSLPSAKRGERGEALAVGRPAFDFQDEFEMAQHFPNSERKPISNTSYSEEFLLRHGSNVAFIPPPPPTAWSRGDLLQFGVMTPMDEFLSDMCFDMSVVNPGAGGMDDGKRSQKGKRLRKRKYQSRSIAEDGMLHGLKLWQFLLQVLVENKHSTIIRWTSKEEGMFKVVDSEGLARLWGEHKNRPDMNYDKMSRAMRYYYNKNLLDKVPRRLYYQFKYCSKWWEKLEAADPGFKMTKIPDPPASLKPPSSSSSSSSPSARCCRELKTENISETSTALTDSASTDVSSDAGIESFISKMETELSATSIISLVSRSREECDSNCVEFQTDHDPECSPANSVDTSTALTATADDLESYSLPLSPSNQAGVNY